MLSQYEIEYVAKYAYMSDHCFDLMALVLGEPFIYQGIIYYYDGKILTINGYDLEKNFAVEERVTRIIKGFEDTETLDAIAYFGPKVLNLTHIVGKQYIEEDSSFPEDFVVDMELDFGSPFSKKINRDLKAAKNRGIHVYIKEIDFLSYHHIKILDEFSLNKQLDSLTRAIIAQLNAYVKAPNIYILEAWKENELIGFASLSLNFEKAFYTMAFFKKGINYASDAIIEKAIEFSRNKGFQKLNLGFSLNEGTYKYKKKWGAIKTCDPYYSTIYTKVNSNYQIDSIGWSNRMYFITELSKN